MLWNNSASVSTGIEMTGSVNGANGNSITNRTNALFKNNRKQNRTKYTKIIWYSWCWYVTLCYYVNHCGVITWIFTYWSCILRWIFVTFGKEWIPYTQCITHTRTYVHIGIVRIPRLFFAVCFFRKTWKTEGGWETKDGKEIVDGRTCADISMSLLIFALPFTFSSVKQKYICILRFFEYL